MKISGFTVIRNAELMDYPVAASISSLLPMVDELIVGVGQSDDGTDRLIRQIHHPKIKIISTHWDLDKNEGGLILSEKTNEALEQCQNDWCFYLQADEVLHQEDHARIHQAVQKAADDPRAEGLLFRFLHFYGSYHYLATSRRWYRQEVRIIRKSSGARSYRDAQGFRTSPSSRKLNVRNSGARIFHYGWVKPPQKMGQKARLLDFWWHGERENRDHEFRYHKQWGLKPFFDTHPESMLGLVESQNWEFHPQRSWRDWRLKDLRYLASDTFEKAFNYRVGEYKPYRLIK